MKKQAISGLDDLLTAGPQETQPEPKRAYKTVCYSLDLELLEKINYIAYWDRRKVNAVVTDALTAYAANWQPKTEKFKPFK